MSENADQPPSVKSREQILQDLEAAGLLRHIKASDASQPEPRGKREGVVLPFRRPVQKAPTRTVAAEMPAARKAKASRIAVVAYLLVLAVVAWVYFGR